MRTYRLSIFYQLVEIQGERDESIDALVSSMRDMLRSLSEVDHREKIELPLSAISLAMTRVRECTDFISTYIQHGFWGGVFYFTRI
jgi:hypothetical protein